jgi:hypothetical protein
MYIGNMTVEEKKLKYHEYLVEMAMKFFEKGIPVVTILDELDQLSEQDIRIMESSDLSRYAAELDRIVKDHYEKGGS